MLSRNVRKVCWKPYTMWSWRNSCNGLKKRTFFTALWVSYYVRRRVVIIYQRTRQTVRNVPGREERVHEDCKSGRRDGATPLMGCLYSLWIRVVHDMLVVCPRNYVAIEYVMLMKEFMDTALRFWFQIAKILVDKHIAAPVPFWTLIGFYLSRSSKLRPLLCTENSILS